MTDGYPVPNAPTAARTGGVRHILAAFPCKTSAKEPVMTNKIAGLYLDLAKALNRLEEAGEDPVSSATPAPSAGTKRTAGGGLSRRERLNLIARRQIDAIGRSSGLAYVAGRRDILDSAKAWVEENGDEYDIMDVLAVAEFLAGDRVEGTA